MGSLCTIFFNTLRPALVSCMTLIVSWLISFVSFFCVSITMLLGGLHLWFIGRKFRVGHLVHCDL